MSGCGPDVREVSVDEPRGGLLRKWQRGAGGCGFVKGELCFVALAMLSL